MNVDEFWHIIDSVHSDSAGDMDTKCDLLKVRLENLNMQDLIDFCDHFDKADARAYSWPLWGAAYVMHGGCSDDAFSDFRATLISLGRNTYETALANPESLAAIHYKTEEDICYEGFQYVPNAVAKSKFGDIRKRKGKFPDTPSGAEWDEDTVRDLYPRLSAKYSSYPIPIVNENQTKKPWWKIW